jgi:hypothetical protein
MTQQRSKFLCSLFSITGQTSKGSETALVVADNEADAVPSPATLRTSGLPNEGQHGRLRGVAEELALVHGG